MIFKFVIKWYKKLVFFTIFKNKLNKNKKNINIVIIINKLDRNHFFFSFPHDFHEYIFPHIL